jgi:subfamily B ATP-binding cassette protein HlyB/CyaB
MQGAGYRVVPEEMSRDDFVWTLGQLCALHRVPFDPGVFVGRVPSLYTQERLVGTLIALGFHVGKRRVAALNFKSVRFPCVAFRRDGAVLLPSIVADCDGAKVVFFDLSSREPQSLPLAKFYEMFDPAVLLLRRDAAPANDPKEARFNFFGLGERFRRL